MKKSLGQHFLTDQNICRKIIATLNDHSFTRLLEIGPGGGALTRYLIGIKDIEFLAVELDIEKIEFLKKEYPAIKDRIIHQDFLDMDMPFSEPFTVIGNFPYNISTQILFKLLEWKKNVECIVGMFQKEVALRIAAAEGNKTYGVTSVLVQAFFRVEYLFDIHENCFHPPPKVKSGMIRLRPLDQPVSMKSEKDFFLLVKTAFNQRRKTLRNAVRGLFDPAQLEEKIFERRAEQLTVQEFAELSFKMK